MSTKKQRVIVACNASRVVGVDPKMSQVWATFQMPTGEVTSLAVYPTPAMLDAFLRMLARFGKQVIVYEDCYSARNVKVYGDLVWLRKRFTEAATKVGLRVVNCSPLTWQSSMLYLEGENSRTVKREEVKKRSCVVASHLMGADVQHPDTADSICLYHYGADILDTVYSDLSSEPTPTKAKRKTRKRTNGK
jgi:hypothetical protein